MPIVVTLWLVLCLVPAGAARAEEWVIAEQPLPVLGISEETTAISGGGSELTVPALSLTVSCTSGSGSGKVVKEGVTGNVTLKLSGCIVKGAEEACTVSSPGQSAGTLAGTATRKFFIVEVENVEQAYEEFVPTMTVEFTGEECIFPEVMGLKGATAAEVPKIEEEVVKRPLKFSKAIVEASGVKGLTLGAQSAYITGEASEALSGTYSEEAFGVTEITIDPSPVKFNEVESKGVVLTNTGPMRAKITKIAIAKGPYTLTDSAPCKGSTLLAKEMCTIGVKCDMTPSVGILEVRWDILAANGDFMGFNTRFVNLTC